MCSQRHTWPITPVNRVSALINPECTAERKWKCCVTNSFSMAFNWLVGHWTVMATLLKLLNVYEQKNTAQNTKNASQLQISKENVWTKREVAPLPKFQWSKSAAYDWKVGYNIGENSKVFLHSILKTLRGNQVAVWTQFMKPNYLVTSLTDATPQSLEKLTLFPSF